MTDRTVVDEKRELIHIAAELLRLEHEIGKTSFSYPDKDAASLLLVSLKDLWLRCYNGIDAIEWEDEETPPIFTLDNPVMKMRRTFEKEKGELVLLLIKNGNKEIEEDYFVLG